MPRAQVQGFHSTQYITECAEAKFRFYPTRARPCVALRACAVSVWAQSRVRFSVVVSDTDHIGRGLFLLYIRFE